MAAEGGLFRFDGSEIRRWAASTIAHMVMDVAVSPGGRAMRARSSSPAEPADAQSRPSSTSTMSKTPLS